MTEEPQKPEQRHQPETSDSGKTEAPPASPQPGKQAAGQEAQPAKEAATEEKTIDDAAPPWELELDTYPLREKAEDPKWAVRTVWIWMGIALASLVFILTLLVLGLIYE